MLALGMGTLGVSIKPGAAQRDRTARMTVPVGTVIPVKMDDTLSSATSRVGDKFAATVKSDKEGDAEFPVGTRIEGTVREAQRAQKDQPGLLDLDFTIVRLPDGQSYRIEGSLISLEDKGIMRTSDGRLVAKNKGSDRTKFIAYGAGAGLVIGALTKHTLEGTLLGAAAGYIYSRSRKESATDVTVKSGMEFGVRLDREVAYNAHRRFADSRDEYRAEMRRVSASSQDKPSDSRTLPKDVKVTFNGRAVVFDKPKPFEEQGEILVPFAPVMKVANVPFKYNEKQQTARVTTSEGEVHIKVGKTFAWIGKDRVDIEAPAQIRDGVVCVPLRFLALATGMRVMWEADTRTVVISPMSGRTTSH
jgi:hypothetical protein